MDILGRELGWQVEAPKINLTRVAAAVVNRERIAIVQETGSRHWWTRKTPLPANIELLDDLADVKPGYHRHCSGSRTDRWMPASGPSGRND
ncbi:cobalamin biosynthesis central domain-containing protein [Lautropia mirabilis]